MNKETYINEEGKVVSGQGATNHHISKLGPKKYIEKYHPEIVKQITDEVTREAVCKAVYDTEISIVLNLYRSISEKTKDSIFSMDGDYIFDYDLIKRVLDEANYNYLENGKMHNPIVLEVW